MLLLQIACALCGYAAPSAIAVTFYRLARRRFLGVSWASLPCVLCAAFASFTFVKTFSQGQGGRLVVGATPLPDPLRLALPLVAAIALEWMRRRSLARQSLIVTAGAA